MVPHPKNTAQSTERLTDDPDRLKHIVSGITFLFFGKLLGIPDICCKKYTNLITSNDISLFNIMCTFILRL